MVSARQLCLPTQALLRPSPSATCKVEVVAERQHKGEDSGLSSVCRPWECGLLTCYAERRDGRGADEAAHGGDGSPGCLQPLPAKLHVVGVHGQGQQGGRGPAQALPHLQYVLLLTNTSNTS